jgi:hypothetical protein
MLVLFGTVFAFVAALAAIYFGRKSLTKTDLTGLERNTAETAEKVEEVRGHIAGVHEIQNEQYSAELICETAKRISIVVKGYSRRVQPMTLYLTTKNPNITLVQAQLTNNIGSSHGERNCELQAPNNFITEISGDTLSAWFSSATKVDTNARRVLIIRAHILYGKLPAEREILVFLSRDGRGYPAPFLKGISKK